MNTEPLNSVNKYDLFNTTSENFNPAPYVTCINNELVNYYAPHHENPDPTQNCRICKIELLDNPPICINECRMTMRGTKKQNKNQKQYFTCETKVKNIKTRKRMNFKIE